MGTNNNGEYKGLGKNANSLKYYMIKSMVEMGLNDEIPFLTVGEKGDITSINAITELNSINLISTVDPFPTRGGGGIQFLNIKGDLQSIVEIEEIGPFCTTGCNEFINRQRAMQLPLVEFASHLTSPVKKSDSNDTVLNYKMGRSDRPITAERLAELRIAAATVDLSKIRQFVLTEKTDDETVLTVLSIAKKNSSPYTIFIGQTALGTKKEDLELMAEKIVNLKLLVGEDENIDSAYNGYSRVYRITKKQQ